MGYGFPIPTWLGNLILVGGGIAILGSVLSGLGVGPYYSAEEHEVNPPPEPAHCYELVDGHWHDICI